MRLLSLICVLVFCASCGPRESQNSQTGTDATQAPSPELEAYVSTSTVHLAESHSAIIDSVLAISQNGTIDLRTQPAPEGSHVILFALTEGLHERAIELTLLNLQSTRSQSLERGSPTAIFTGLEIAVVVGGLAMGGAALYSLVSGTTERQMKPMKERIVQANPDELAAMKRLMNAPDDVDEIGLLEHFEENMSLDHQNTAAKEIVAEFNLDANDNLREFGQEWRLATADAAVHAGKEGVKLVASNSAAAVGHGGAADVGKLVNASDESIGFVNLLLSAVSALTEEPLNPVDVAAKKMEVWLESDETKEAEMPVHSEDLPPVEEAEETLEVAAQQPAEVPVEDVDDAMASAALDLLEALPDLGSRRTDDAVFVETPDRMTVVEIDEPDPVISMAIPELGLGTARVLFEGHPVHVTDVDASADLEIKVPLDVGEDEPATTNNANGSPGGVAGHCFLGQDPICVNFTGSSYHQSTTGMEVTCEGWGTSRQSGACPAEGAFGACTTNVGAPNEMQQVYYDPEDAAEYEPLCSMPSDLTGEPGVWSSYP